MAIDSSGRIVIAGAAQNIDTYGNVTSANFLLFRMTPNGAIDATFASDYGGYRLVNFDLTGIGAVGNDTATDLAVQSDGKIVAVGNAYFNATQSHFAAIRVDNTGNLDATFGAGGMVHFGTPSAYSNVVHSLAIDTADNLVLAGSTGYVPNGSPQYYAAVARLTSLGTLDPTFNSTYVQEFPLWSQPPTIAPDNAANAVGVDGANRIVVAGGYDTSTISGAAAQRLTSGGLLDSTFAAGAPAPIPQPYFLANGIYVESTGAFAVCGYGFGSTQGVVFLAKFLADGTADVTFGTNGVAAFPFNAVGTATFVAPTKRGGWLMAGPYAQQGVFLAKVLANGQPDTTLGGTGFVSIYFEPNNLFNMAKPALTRDGKLIVAGTLPEEAANGSGNIGVMRILADYDTVFVSDFEAQQ